MIHNIPNTTDLSYSWTQLTELKKKNYNAHWMNSHSLHTSIVSVVQLGDSLDLAVLHRWTLLIQLCLSFEPNPVEYALHDSTVGRLQNTKTKKTKKQQHCEVKEIQLFYVMNCLKAFNLCLLTALINFSDRGHLDPKFLVWSVMFSFVWESKEGFSIRAFTNTQMWFFTWGKEGEKGQSI